MPSPSVFSAASLAEFLVIPDAPERLSPVGGPGVLILDIEADPAALSDSQSRALASAMASLPCVVIGSGTADTESKNSAILAKSCDVRVLENSDVDRLLGGFAKTPISALAFVQLLRAETGQRGTAVGLAAESFVYSTLQSGAEFKAWRSGRAGSRRPAVDSEPACRMTRDGDRLKVELTRADKHNAFSRRMRDDLCEALQLACIDESILEVSLSGEGPSFCSGGDLDEFGSFTDPATAHAIRTTRSPALLMSQVSDRVTSHVHGACIGAGIELPAFGHRIVAEADAYFQLPEVGLGLVPGAGGTVSLPRRIGRQRTAWLGLSSEKIDAPTALEWGLVDEIRLA